MFLRAHPVLDDRLHLATLRTTGFQTPVAIDRLVEVAVRVKLDREDQDRYFVSFGGCDQLLERDKLFVLAGGGERTSIVEARPPDRVRIQVLIAPLVVPSSPPLFGVLANRATPCDSGFHGLSSMSVSLPTVSLLAAVHKWTREGEP